MNQLSDRLNSLSPSATLAMSQKSNELKAQGIDVINLSVGEPDFNTPDHIKEAAKKAVDDNFSRYSPVPGYPALRNAIVEKLKKENGLEYTAAQISCANGAKQSVCNTILVLVNPGDEVIVPAPYWVSYPEMVKMAEGTPVIVSAGIEQDFKITPEQLEAAITPKTKALILCSPSNQLYRCASEYRSIPRNEGTYSDCKRCIQGLRYDRMENRFHCRSGMDCKSLQQVARSVHFRSLLCFSKSC